LTDVPESIYAKQENNGRKDHSGYLPVP